MATDPDRRPDASGLRALNLIFGLIHLAQGVVFIVLSQDVDVDVSALYPTGPPGEAVTPDRLDVLFSYPLGPAVATFSLLSAFFHLLIASPWGWPRYVGELGRCQNRLRWIEYSLSASLMIVLIAGITGISDVAALIALFGVNASMILFGWLMETKNEPGRDVDWSPFVFGCLAGAVPWIAIAVYLFGAGDSVPTFVYGIFVSIFVFFNCFAVNQWLQYRQVGRWRDDLFGERVYVWLSLIAKSALAWQIFANVLTG
ncbi:MAG: heliorhodopsin HeR [Ilumatobacteraceae bacterium]